MAIATTMSARQPGMLGDRPHDQVQQQTFVGYILDAFMILVQLVMYCVEVVVMLVSPLLLLIAIFPIMLAVAVLVMLFGSLFGGLR